MAQTGYTPISIYYSSTATNVPTAGNLVAGELAINTNDGILYYKDSSGVVQSIASKAVNSGSFTNLAYTGTFTGGTGVVNLGSGQFYKDASGNVGIGTSSPANKLDVNGTGRFRADAGGATILLIGRASDGLSQILNYNNAGTVINQQFQFLNDGTYVFVGASAERMRIDSSGNLLVGLTSASGPGYNNANTGVQIAPDGTTYISKAGNITSVINNNGSGNLLTSFNYQGTLKGSISLVGTTAVAFNTTSDYRLKENIAPITGALAKVQALKPCSYTWKSAPDEIGEGFIAHELAEVCPQAVTGEKDAVDAEGKPIYQGIDTSFLVATLTAALQELNAKVTALEAQLSKP